MSLPLQIARIGGGETLGNGEGRGEGREGLLEHALRQQHVADLTVIKRQEALWAHIVAVESNQALDNGEAVAVGLKRLVELSLRLERVAGFFVRHYQIPLPPQIAQIGGEAP